MTKKTMNNLDQDEPEIPCVKKYKCRILQIEGTRYRTMFTSKFENRKKYIAPEPGKIISVLPGTVIEIMVKKGQFVKKDQPLLIFEAMKMMNRLTAHVDGEITEIYIKKGDIISKGQALVQIS